MARTQKIAAQPAARLLRTLPEVPDAIACIDWSPNGNLIAAGSRRGLVSVWESETGALAFQSDIHSYHVYNTRWSPDGALIAASDDNGRILILDPFSGSQVRSITLPIAKPAKDKSFRPSVMGLAWSPDSKTIAAGCVDCLRLVDSTSAQVLHVFAEQRRLTGVVWSPDGRQLASTSYEGTICLWDALTAKLLHRFQAGYSPALAWSPDSTLLATANENSIVVLDASSGRPAHILEGHVQTVRALSFSGDGKYLASRAGYKASDEHVDTRLMLWDTKSWVMRRALKVTGGRYLFTGLAFSPSGPLLATSSNEDLRVQIWKLDFSSMASQAPRITPFYYKNAKVALVGDAGVGKSGLALVLTGHRFVATHSTHARHVRFLSRSAVKNTSASESRETVLWDLAGQPGYRLIHQLHLSDVNVALLLFDARNELDPFAGIRHWDRALRQASTAAIESANTDPKKILVAARIDRGPVKVGTARVRKLMAEMCIDAYCETSAKEGTGIELLAQQISGAIDWDSLPTVSSTVLLKKFRTFVVRQRKAGAFLTTVDQLFRGFQESLTPKTRSTFSRGTFESYIQRLQCLGDIRSFSFGDLILLQPERLDAYASSIIFAAQQEPDGMGSIYESAVREGRFNIPSDQRIPTKGEERLLLMATIEDLIAHEIAFREVGDDGTLLVFPSQLTRESPDLPDAAGKEVLIEFTGPVLSAYATLVVRLAHSRFFKLNDLWRNAAVFAAGTDDGCGVFLTEQGDGRGVLTLFYTHQTPSAIRQQFEDYVVAHIKRRANAESVRLKRVLMCSACGTPIPEIAITKRQEKGFDSIVCSVCETRTVLPVPAGETHFAAPTMGTVQIDLNADHRRALDTTLTSASGEMLSDRFRKWAGSSRSTLALVFTDLVGSTALGEKLGDELMSGIRDAHFRTVRQLISKYKAYEVKTIGDAFMVAFRTATEALNFCMDVQERPGDHRLTLRAGLHVGPVRIDDEDAFGNMVNFASRVVGFIKGAEIWVSDRAFRDIQLERAASHRKLEWAEHNGLELKGFQGTHTLWQLRRR